MLKNKKGFTLIESIITIAMFAILGTMLVAGFSTVIRHMGEAAEIKNSTNEVFSTVEKATTENGKTNVTIEIEGQGTIYEEGISVFSDVEEIDASFNIELNKFFKSTVDKDISKTFYDKVVSTKNHCLTSADWVKSFNSKFAEFTEKEITIGKGLSLITDNADFPSNTGVNQYLYLMEIYPDFYPTIEDTIIKKYNEIIMEEQQKGTPYAERMIFSESTKVYMKAIFIPKDNKVMLVADVDSNSYRLNQWRTRMVYIVDELKNEGNWYAKMYHKITEKDDTSNWYRFTTDLQDKTPWSVFLAEINDSSRWRKIEVN